MTTRLQYAAFSVLGLAIAAGSFIFGQKSGAQIPYQLFSVQLAEVQAQLGVNHLLKFRELENDLSKGCLNEVREKISIAIDQELMLLTEFHKEHRNSTANEYISRQDPQLLKELDSFKSKYSNGFQNLKCNK